MNVCLEFNEHIGGYCFFVVVVFYFFCVCVFCFELCRFCFDTNCFEERVWIFLEILWDIFFFFLYASMSVIFRLVKYEIRGGFYFFRTGFSGCIKSHLFLYISRS